MKKIYGAKLLFESGMANFIHIAPKIGLAICDEKVKEYIFLSINF